MEQRRLRLGDILDDYCPRERRVTNHAIVAMIEDDIKQTRCTTCDAEHAYKGGKAPRRRATKEAPATLYKEVLAGMPDVNVSAHADAHQSAGEPDVEDTALSESEPESELELAGADAVDEDAEPVTVAPSEPAAPESTPAPDVEDGPVHRPLIRATLPRPEGQKDARPLPEFTIRQAGNRANGNFRGGDPRMRQRGPGGNGRPHGGTRFAGARPHGRGQPNRGPAGGFRQSQPARHGGKKRSR